MRKVILVLCMFLVVTALSANTKLNFIHHYEKFINNEFTNEEFGEFAREMSSHIRDFRDEYMLEVLYEEWVDDAWVYEAKDIYTYDGNAYPIEMLNLIWVEDAWQNAMRMIITNNAEGYIVEMLWQMWEPTSETWMDMVMVFYTYDANWNMTEMLIQMWFGDGWLNSSRFTMTYNADNNPTYVLLEEWDFPDGTEWENDDQEFYTYDGLFLEEIFEESWENDSEWIWSIKHTYTLAGNYHPATSLRENWDGGGFWYNVRYSEHTYDGDWNEIQDFEQEWNGNEWENFQDKYYTYNEDGYMIERLTMDWEGGRDWINGSRHTMTYGTLDAEDNSISPNNDLVLSNYPNPFSSTTTISFSTTENTENTEISIYNLKGQQIRSLECINRVNAKATKSLSSIIWNGTDGNGKLLSSGIYLIKLKSDKDVISKKITLIR